MNDVIQERHILLSSLQQLVDNLRDLQGTYPEEINESIQSAFDSFHASCGFKELERLKVPHVGHDSIREVLDQIRLCTEHNPSVERVESHHQAPNNLLSLRDYSILQAAIELAICWGAYRLVNHSISSQQHRNGESSQIEVNILTPIRNRRPTKTFQIKSSILEWRQKYDSKDPQEELLKISHSLVRLLLLPEFRPILLSKYLVDLFAVIIYGKACLATKKETREAFESLYATLIKELPLQLSMSNIRAVLGQCQLTGLNDSEEIFDSNNIEIKRFEAFKKACGKCLSTLILERGGVKTTLEMLLGSVQEGDTQARMQLASLITKCPSLIPADQYDRHLYSEIKDILLTENSDNVIKETSVLVLTHHITDSQAFSQQNFEAHFLNKVFAALLLVDQKECSGKVESIQAAEEEIEQSIRILRLFLCGVPVTSKVLTALNRVFYPALLLYCFTEKCKSYLLGQIRPILINWIHGAEDPITLITIALEKESFPKDKDHSIEFRAGGSGGVVLQICKVEGSDDISAALPTAIVSLLSDNLEASNVAGKMFTYLLTEHMQMKRSSTFEKNGAYKAIILSLMVAMMEKFGASVLQDTHAIFDCLRTILTVYQMRSSSQRLVDFVGLEQNHDIALIDSDENDDDELITLGLGILTTIIEVGARNRSESEEDQLRQFLAILGDLSSHKRPEIAGLAADARANILSRGLEAMRPRSMNLDDRNDFICRLNSAKLDLESNLVPLRARGIVSLTKLVRSCVRREQTQEWIETWDTRIRQLLAIYIDHLSDEESYVYLAAIQGLATLADAYPKLAIPLLVENLQDKNLTLEARIKLSEAVLFSARRCGETLPVYAKPLLYAFLDCVRDREEVSHPNSGDCVGRATFRASCLSNVAEVCVLLGWSLEPFVLDVLTCAFGILQFETVRKGPSNSSSNTKQFEGSDTISPVVTIRRAAVFLLKYLIQMLGWKLIDLIPERLHALYHILGVVKNTDRDKVVLYHAVCAMNALGDVMKGEVFPDANSVLPERFAALRIGARPASTLRVL